MTDEFKLDRHDFASCEHMGTTMAMEVAVAALLASRPDRAALASAWRAAEDTGFTWTADPDPRVGDQRKTWVQQAYIQTLDRLREAALRP